MFTVHVDTGPRKKRAKKQHKPHCVLSKVKSADTKVIYFNSKSTEVIKLKDGTMAHICKLSNLFGGAEFEYMANRFPQHEIVSLFDTLEKCDSKTFLSWLKKLQPKKEWTPLKETFWFCDGTPIRGILAQMLGTMVRDTPTAKNRRRIVATSLNIDDIDTYPELSEEDKKKWMEVCLTHKYSMDSEFRAILLATGTAILHEKPMRGSPNNWSYKKRDDGQAEGGDWLGQLLMTLRDEMRLE
jgi:hypothetical protein